MKKSKKTPAQMMLEEGRPGPVDYMDPANIPAWIDWPTETSGKPKIWISQADVARLIGVSPRTVSRMRITNTGPKWAKVTRHVVRYRRDWVLQYMAEAQRGESVCA